MKELLVLALAVSVLLIACAPSTTSSITDSTVTIQYVGEVNTDDIYRLEDSQTNVVCYIGYAAKSISCLPLNPAK